MEYLTQSVGEYIQAIVAFIELNQRWVIPITFLLAFGESLAFISLVLPSTVILVAISALLGKTGIGPVQIFWVWFAAGFGGALGYWASYLIGAWFKDDVTKIWPFSTRPEMLVRGREFFDRWGTLGVFLGHFFGPVRAVVPVIAGMLAMKQLPFQLANISSAFLWAFGVLVLPLFGVRFFVT
jgi:membrane protein DedA with SNARE-associated domain